MTTDKELKEIYKPMNQRNKVKFVVDKPEHKPFKKHNSDAGFDIFADENVIIPANSFGLVQTCIKVAIPFGYVGILKSRSGMACKHGVETGAGVIDSNYRGYLKVKLFNNSDENFVVKIGEKITQMVIIPINLNEWEEVDSLDETDRGQNGFGSTGK